MTTKPNCSATRSTRRLRSTIQCYLDGRLQLQYRHCILYKNIWQIFIRATYLIPSSIQFVIARWSVFHFNHNPVTNNLQLSSTIFKTKLCRPTLCTVHNAIGCRLTSVTTHVGCQPQWTNGQRRGVSVNQNETLVFPLGLARAETFASNCLSINYLLEYDVIDKVNTALCTVQNFRRGYVSNFTSNILVC